MRPAARGGLAAGLITGLLALLLALLLTGCGESTVTPAGRGSSTQAASAGSASVSASASASAQRVVPVYFVGPTPSGPRLFSELRSVDADDPVDGALAELAAGPADPDYASYLPPGAPTEVSYDESLVLEMPGPVWRVRPNGLSDQQVRLAVQQVVLTADAAIGRKIPLSFVDGGGNSHAFLGSTAPSATNGFVAADEIEVLAHVNVTSPEQGQGVSGVLTAGGTASSFEGSVPWQVLDSAGKAVVEGVGQGGGDLASLVAWTASVDVSGLAPGDYTFVAMTDDPTGGTEGAGPTSDTKTITVS